MFNDSEDAFACGQFCRRWFEPHFAASYTTVSGNGQLPERPAEAAQRLGRSWRATSSLTPFHPARNLMFARSTKTIRGAGYELRWFTFQTASGSCRRYPRYVRLVMGKHETVQLCAARGGVNR